MIGSIRRPNAQNPRISKKIRGFQIIAESSGGFAKSVRHQWITRPYRSRGHRSDRRRETFLLIPIVYRVNHAGNSGSHCKENRAAERITKHGADKESEHSVKHHGDKLYDSPEIFQTYSLRILIIRIKKSRKPISGHRPVFDITVQYYISAYLSGFRKSYRLKQVRKLRTVAVSIHIPNIFGAFFFIAPNSIIPSTPQDMISPMPTVKYRYHTASSSA